MHLSCEFEPTHENRTPLPLTRTQAYAWNCIKGVHFNPTNIAGDWMPASATSPRRIPPAISITSDLELGTGDTENASALEVIATVAKAPMTPISKISCARSIENILRTALSSKTTTEGFNLVHCRPQKTAAYSGRTRHLAPLACWRASRFAR